MNSEVKKEKRYNAYALCSFKSSALEAYKPAFSIRITQSRKPIMRSQRIAVAGGTGKIGRHIVEGLLEAKHRHSFEIIVLSRSQSPDISYAGFNAPVIPVDYQDQSSLQKVLNEFQIDTIISTLAGRPAELVYITSQENLLRAALSVPSFRRFAPSEFAIESEQISASVNLYQNKLPIIQSLRQVKQERPDSFEFSLFECGVFMNYLGYGNTRPEGHKAHGHLAHFPYIFDLSKRSADIPGDGEKEIWYTRAEDVGKFVAEATQLETWEEYNNMAGEILTMNEVVRLCEDVCGTEFNVKYNSREELAARISPAPEKARANFFVESLIAIIDGECDIKRPMNLNKLVDVQPMGVRQYLEQWWGSH
ncbi:hypothetical protein F5890DRAFT_1545627 [Lentinula detonsa]|uniref:NmrA-like domain-containing protein n=1 Tax=Lentinula detonsa TaxID=2804962 RepID=A0AA38UNH2_9AGAR|nr:hypothetical protein F5890DRAFT_1545627 [Lentinula detonsa]